jgi:homoserine kinase
LAAPLRAAGTTLPVGRSVTVEVPATSANLGPGFDCFGLALDWTESVQLEVLESGYRIDVSGEGADQLPRNESHLILRSALIGLADLGEAAPGLALTCHNTIPHGRGLGSSSAAIVAGLAAAQALTGRQLDRSWLLGHADAIEGHPDNVAAAVFGGFTLAYDGPAGITAASGRVSPDLGVVLFVPDTPVATSAARGLLPALVPHQDAAANAGRAALLVHAMAGDLRLLPEATRDWLHQDQRQSAMPQSYELMQRLRGRGFAAVISGAGPTVLVLGPVSAQQQLVAEPQPGFHARAVGIGTGARVTGHGAPTHCREKK